MKITFNALGFLIFLSACSSSTKKSERTDLRPEKAISYIAEGSIFKSPIKELSDKEYPDNPDIATRHILDGSFSHHTVAVERTKNTAFNLLFYPANEQSDTLIFTNINLLEYMPTVPEWVKKDDYLTHIGFVNQEWNRQQVRYNRNEFEIKGTQLESASLVRVDIARNCLNAYLWEIIGYAMTEEGSMAPCYHGWFNFPKELYKELFEKRNNLPYDTYKASLEEWIDPDSRPVDLSIFRTIDSEKEISFTSLNDQYYTLCGARKSKFKNIIYPDTGAITKIEDFLNDSTTFATFSIPGFYNTKAPRHTTLSKLGKLVNVTQREVTSANDTHDKVTEFELLFESNKDQSKTTLVIGGIELSEIPRVGLNETQKGLRMPMGIANHSFYESYHYMDTHDAKQCPYYAFLLDENGNWIDSHYLGIDGPLLHFDTKNNKKLHFWILAFERHAFVGHFTWEI